MKEYQSYTDEWFQLNSKLESEKSSPSRKEFTKKLYENFMANVTSTICDWKKGEIKKNQIQLDCKKIMVNNNYKIIYIVFYYFKEIIRYNYLLSYSKGSLYSFSIKQSNNINK